MTEGRQGGRILVVEDDDLLATDLAVALEDAGATVVGPAASVEAALDLLAGTAHLDGAVLDLNLRGEMSYPVADALCARGVPLVIATGCDQSAIPSRYADLARCEKPVQASRILETLWSEQAG